VLHFKAEIKENIPVSKNHYLLTFTPLAKTPVPLPGQFYMIGIGNSCDPLLKRPFSILTKSDDSIRILYRIKGKGTTLMKEMKTGTVINVMGPLGNSYPIPKKKHTPLIIAGGIGIASVFYLAEKLKGKAIVLYGARGKHELLMLDELRGLVKELHISTDDGSYGKKGTIIDLLNEFHVNDKHLIYACGPKGMIRAVSEFALEKGLKGYISLEENMACGIGACMGCAVKTLKGYKRVCKEGPVFNIKDILW
jgi:dihydroorotate dehydrogenase electron transfer subunit